MEKEKKSTDFVMREHELQKFMEYVFTMPHAYGREIENYFNMIAMTRDKEREEAKEDSKTEVKATKETKLKKA